MRTLEVEVKNKLGLHARPSSLFVETATNYDSEIMVICDDEEVNGKSIMGLMLLAAEQGRKLTLTAEGDDEEEAIEALRELIEVRRFDED